MRNRQWQLVLSLLIVVYTCVLVVGVSGRATTPSTQVIQLDKVEQWSLYNSNRTISLQGIKLPGSLHIHLLDHGVISEPYFGYNDVIQKWVVYDNWTYVYEFDTPVDCQQQTCRFVFNGLDTVSTISLLIAGTTTRYTLGSTNNMHRCFKFNVNVNIPASSKLVVDFISAVHYAKQQAASYPYIVPFNDNLALQNGEPNRNMIRKTQSSFSWDWGPSFPTIAFQYPVLLEITPKNFARIEKVLVESKPIGGAVSTTYEIHSTVVIHSTNSENVEVSIRQQIKEKHLSIHTVSVSKGENRISLKHVVDDVKLWYPSGYGEATLYNLETTLTMNEQNIETVTKRIGFRSIEVVQDMIDGNPQAKTFFFRVNGIPVFAKGANYIPIDSFIERITEEEIKLVLDNAKLANMNMVRVWGGGYFQSDYFYDKCDEYGLLVWQEMMFACSMYPRDQGFLSNIEQEVIYQAERLLHHPSIAIYGGNNENEASLWDNTWYFPTLTLNNKTRYAIDYSALYYDTIHTSLRKVDQSTYFWVSSPSNGYVSTDPLVGFWDNPYSDSIGDVHYYNYAAACTDVTKFPKGRFISEYGFQSYASLTTFKTITDNSSELAPFSNLMRHRQHHPNGMTEIPNQMEMYFRKPTSAAWSFTQFIYLTQVLQAIGIKSQTEYYRANKNIKSIQTYGALYWQLNSIWQTIDWSSIEYGNRWKMLHNYAKNFFNPVLISSYDDGQYKVYITSDINQSIKVQYSIRVINYERGQIMYTVNNQIIIPALGNECVLKQSMESLLLLAKCTERQCMVHLSAFVDGVLTSENVYYPSTYFTEIILRVPKIHTTVTTESDTSAQVEIVSDSVALFVWLDYGNLKGVVGRFSDNGFALLPNESRKITFETSKGEKLDLALFTQQLTVTSLRDSY